MDRCGRHLQTQQRAQPPFRKALQGSGQQQQHTEHGVWLCQALRCVQESSPSWSHLVHSRHCAHGRTSWRFCSRCIEGPVCSMRRMIMPSDHAITGQSSLTQCALGARKCTAKRYMSVLAATQCAFSSRPTCCSRTLTPPETTAAAQHAARHRLTKIRYMHTCAPRMRTAQRKHKGVSTV